VKRTESTSAGRTVESEAMPMHTTMCSACSALHAVYRSRDRLLPSQTASITFGLALGFVAAVRQLSLISGWTGLSPGVTGKTAQVLLKCTKTIATHSRRTVPTIIIAVTFMLTEPHPATTISV
jgi:hypothetical protein